MPKRFCVMTVGRSGSTSLMYSLRNIAGIALPSQDLPECIDDELIHPERLAAATRDYEGLVGHSINTPNALIDAFFHHHRAADYAGFKTMPQRHEDFDAFVRRGDITFIGVLRRDIPSTVASQLVAHRWQTWRRSGESHERQWEFSSGAAPDVDGAIWHAVKRQDQIREIPNVIEVYYEDLVQPHFKNDRLDDFFATTIRLEKTGKPTCGSDYVLNWEQFCQYVNDRVVELSV